MKEPELKKLIKQWLVEIGAWYYMVVPNGYSRRGVPDFLCMHKGVAFAIETKTTGKKPTGLQEEEIIAMATAGYLVYVVDSMAGIDAMKKEIAVVVTDQQEIGNGIH